jgi:hypothetical protein
MIFVSVTVFRQFLIHVFGSFLQVLILNKLAEEPAPTKRKARQVAAALFGHVYPVHIVPSR